MIRQIFGGKGRRRRAEMASMASAQSTGRGLVAKPKIPPDPDPLLDYILYPQSDGTPPGKGVDSLRPQRRLQVAAGDDFLASDMGGDLDEEEEEEDEEDEPKGGVGSGVGAGASSVHKSATLAPEPTDPEKVRQKEEANMILMYQRARAPKKLQFPSKYPAYLKERPRLKYEETETSLRRKLYNRMKLSMAADAPVKPDKKKLIHMTPKLNAAVRLRHSYIRREPLEPKYFADHFDKYQKPPFKLLRTNQNCNSKLRSAWGKVRTFSTTPSPRPTTTPLPSSAASTTSAATVEPTVTVEIGETATPSAEPPPP